MLTHFLVFCTGIVCGIILVALLSANKPDDIEHKCFMSYKEGYEKGYDDGYEFRPKHIK
jgi:hypothetical protein